MKQVEISVNATLGEKWMVIGKANILILKGTRGGIRT